MNLPWGHFRSNTKFEPDPFICLPFTTKQTERQAKYKDKFKCQMFYKFRLLIHAYASMAVECKDLIVLSVWLKKDVNMALVIFQENVTVMQLCGVDICVMCQFANQDAVWNMDIASKLFQHLRKKSLHKYISLQKYSTLLV